MKKNYGSELNSYDVLKAATLVAVLIYHACFFFFPYLSWFFAVGILWPAWFFLMGYARSRDVPLAWLLCGAALMLSNIMTGGSLFPLNILFTFAVIRLTIDYVASWAKAGAGAFALVVFVLVLLGFPSALLLEYGAFGMLWALYGIMRRNPSEFRISPVLTGIFMAGLAGITWAVLSLVLPVVSPAQYWVMGAGSVAVVFVLSRFEPVLWPGFGASVPGLVPLIQFLGRWTLEIYVIHLLVFRLIAAILYPQILHFRGFEILPFGLL